MTPAPTMIILELDPRGSDVLEARDTERFKFNSFLRPGFIADADRKAALRLLPADERRLTWQDFGPSNILSWKKSFPAHRIRQW